jgi:hypothetical protein
VKPKDISLDYSGYRPDPSNLYHDGARAIMRYSAGQGNDQSDCQWKLCTKNELRDAVNVGLDFFALSEWYETRVQEGKGAGQHDGAADLSFWKGRGLAEGAAIYVAWDTNPDQDYWDNVDNYLKAYGKALDGYYQVAIYAGTPYLKHAFKAGVAEFGCRPNAGSWSNDGLPYQPPNHGRNHFEQALDATPAHVWQTGNYWYGKNADENLILRSPCGSHLEAQGGYSPDVDPEDDDMNKEDTRSEIAAAFRNYHLGSDGSGHWTPENYPNWIKDQQNGVGDRLTRLEKQANK